MSRPDEGTTQSPSVASLLDAPTGLVMIGRDGSAPVCADGVCGPVDDVPHPNGGTSA